MITPEISFAAALLAVLLGVLVNASPGSFAAYLARLRLRSGERGIDVIIAWVRARRVRRQDRRDVVQNVVLEALKSWRRFEIRAPNAEQTLFEHWLFAIMRHMVSHHLGKAYHRREELRAAPIDAEVPDPGPAPHDELQDEQVRVAMATLLEALPLDLRVILVAHYIDGISMPEIAEQHGMPLHTMYKWRARAIERLQERPSDGAALAAWRTARQAWRNR